MDGGNDVLDIINLSTNVLVAKVPTGNNPEAVALSTSSGLVYVANKLSSNITVVNPANGYSTTTIAVASYPYDIAVNPVNDKLHVAHCWSTPRISIINSSKSNAVVNITPTVSYQWRVAVDPGSGRVYTSGANGIGCSCNSSITVLDPNTNATLTVGVGQLPNDMTINSNTGAVYVENLASSFISVISPAGSYAVTTVQVASSAAGLTMDASGRIWASLQAAQEIAVIDPSHGYSVTSIPLGGQPSAVSFDGSANLIIAALPGSSTGVVTFIEPTSLSVIKNVSLNSSESGLLTSTPLMQSYVLSSSGVASIQIRASQYVLS